MSVHRRVSQTSGGFPSDGNGFNSIFNVPLLRPFDVCIHLSTCAADTGLYGRTRKRKPSSKRVRITRGVLSRDRLVRGPLRPRPRAHRLNEYHGIQLREERVPRGRDRVLLHPSSSSVFHRTAALVPSELLAYVIY